MSLESFVPNGDDLLDAAFADDPAPPTPPGLPFRVRRRLRRHQLTRRLAAPLAAVLVLAAGALMWYGRPGPAPEVARGPAPAEAVPAFLHSEPPVDTLDLLARQEAAYLTVLDQLEKEF